MSPTFTCARLRTAGSTYTVNSSPDGARNPIMRVVGLMEVTSALTDSVFSIFIGSGGSEAQATRSTALAAARAALTNDVRVFMVTLHPLETVAGPKPGILPRARGGRQRTFGARCYSR